ncbi:F0F1 ATP synthase subunit delta [Smaragdicoccus niigatensis]|nr:F0F1 ATP synthase subunit delta [Smaragdicoccus niigatensis]
MQAASRESISKLSSSFDSVISTLDDASLTTLADELAAVARLLAGEVTLRKHLANRADEAAPKQAAVRSLLSSRVSAPTLSLVEAAVSLRWSKSRDLKNAIQRLARLALIVSAERAGQIENVEDELFRFSRVLESNSRLASLLGDPTAAADGRIQLLERVLAGKTTSHTAGLLAQTVRGADGSNLSTVVADLAELAAARRNESVAHVTAPVALSDGQDARLTAVLSKIYGRKISVQVEVDSSIGGGLVIRLGDEVIDGSIAARLSAAAGEIPR